MLLYVGIIVFDARKGKVSERNQNQKGKVSEKFLRNFRILISRT